MDVNDVAKVFYESDFHVEITQKNDTLYYGSVNEQNAIEFAHAWKAEHPEDIVVVTRGHGMDGEPGYEDDVTLLKL